MYELYVHGLFSASVFSCFRFVVHYLVLLSSCFCFAFCNFLHSAINAANGGRPQPQQWQRHHGHASRPQLACCQALFPLAKWFDGGTSAPSGQLRDEGMIHPAGRAGSALFALLLDASPTPASPARLHNIIFHIVRSLACHFLHYATVSPPIAKQDELVQVLARSLKASPIPSTIFQRSSIPRPTLSICALKFVFNFWLSTFLFFRSPALSAVPTAPPPILILTVTAERWNHKFY